MQEKHIHTSTGRHRKAT